MTETGDRHTLETPRKKEESFRQGQRSREKASRETKGDTNPRTHRLNRRDTETQRPEKKSVKGVEMQGQKTETNRDRRGSDRETRKHREKWDRDREEWDRDREAHTE